MPKARKPKLNNVRRLRKEVSLTLTELAHGCGLSVAFLNKVERFLVGTSDENQRKIAEYIGKPVEEVFPKNAEPEPVLLEPEEEQAIEKLKEIGPATKNLQRKIMQNSPIRRSKTREMMESGDNPVEAAQPAIRKIKARRESVILGEVDSSETDFSHVVTGSDDPEARKTSEYLRRAYGGRRLA